MITILLFGIKGGYTFGSYIGVLLFTGVANGLVGAGFGDTWRSIINT